MCVFSRARKIEGLGVEAWAKGRKWTQKTIRILELSWGQQGSGSMKRSGWFWRCSVKECHTYVLGSHQWPLLHENHKRQAVSQQLPFLVEGSQQKIISPLLWGRLVLNMVKCDFASHLCIYLNAYIYLFVCVHTHYLSNYPGDYLAESRTHGKFQLCDFSHVLVICIFF